MLHSPKRRPVSIVSSKLNSFSSVQLNSSTPYTLHFSSKVTPQLVLTRHKKKATGQGWLCRLQQSHTCTKKSRTAYQKWMSLRSMIWFIITDVIIITIVIKSCERRANISFMQGKVHREEKARQKKIDCSYSLHLCTPQGIRVRATARLLFPFYPIALTHQSVGTKI
jgi:hypothetical protein